MSQEKIDRLYELQQEGKDIYGKGMPYQEPLQNQLVNAEKTSKNNTAILAQLHNRFRNLAPGVPEWVSEYSLLFKDDRFKPRQILMRNKKKIDLSKLAGYGLDQRDQKEIEIILGETNVQYVIRVYKSEIEKYRQELESLKQARNQGFKVNQEQEFNTKGMLTRLFNEASYICMQVERNDETLSQFTLPLMCACGNEVIEKFFVCKTFYCGWFICGDCEPLFNSLQRPCINCGADPGQAGEAFVENKLAVAEEDEMREEEEDGEEEEDDDGEEEEDDDESEME